VEKGQFRDRDSLIVSEQELNDQSTKLDSRLALEKQFRGTTRHSRMIQLVLFAWRMSLRMFGMWSGTLLRAIWYVTSLLEWLTV
jgi:hypothetical protein